MSMMDALFGKSGHCELAPLLNLARELSRSLPDNLVPGREDDREVLLASVSECGAKIESSTKLSDVEAAAINILHAHAAYNRETAAFLEETRGKTERLIELVNCTAGKVHADLEETLAEVDAFEKELERAAATNSVRSYMPRFKERLARFKKRAEQDREQVERAMTMSAAQFPHLRPAQLIEAEEDAAEPQVAELIDSEPRAASEPDPLTGLPARADAEDLIPRLIEAKSNACLLAVIIDQMSMITHRYGNSIAEDVVLFYAQLLGQHLRPNELTYRWSDRCFLCVLHRGEAKHVLRDQLNWFLGTRYKRNMQVDNRSAMLNVGASFKIWPVQEFKSVQQFAKVIDSHIEAVAA